METLINASDEEVMDDVVGAIKTKLGCFLLEGVKPVVLSRYGVAKGDEFISREEMVSYISLMRSLPLEQVDRLWCVIFTGPVRIKDRFKDVFVISGGGGIYKVELQ